VNDAQEFKLMKNKTSIKMHAYFRLQIVILQT